jgi:hypothetical protein
MLRVLFYVSMLAVLFAGAVFWAGNAIGSWEPPSVPLHAPGAAAKATTKAHAHHPKKHHGRARHAKNH